MRPENRKSRLALLSILTAFVFGVTGAAVAAEPRLLHRLVTRLQSVRP